MRLRMLAVALVPAVALAGVGLGAGPSAAMTPAKAPVKAPAKVYPQLSAFPAPGSRTASPTTTLTIRGVTPANLGSVTIKGTASAVHPFTVRPDSDGYGASLVLDRPFTPGETVKVTTALAIPGSVKGTYYFKVATPVADTPTFPSARSDAAHAQTFVSAPDLRPPVVTITKNTTSNAEGDLFLDPHSVSLQQGPLIVDGKGSVVWFHPVPSPLATTDFRVQTWQGKQVLTWWQGGDTGGHGYGVDEIYGADYQPIAEVHAGNGYQSDAHEFSLTAAGTALVTAYSAVQWDLSPVGGSRTGSVLDSIVQEIDVATGNVLYEWHSLDHVAVADSYAKIMPGMPFDYFHVNSVDKAPNGNLLVSSRVTSTVYDLDRTTGKVIWRLGGKHSSYTLGKGVTLSFQHNARWHADGTITLFDNAVGAPSADWRSHGLRIRLDSKTMTASLVAGYTYPNGLLAPTQGDLQVLPDTHVFIGYGQRSQFAEYTAAGALVLAGTLPEGTSSYRTFRFPWVGAPVDPPTLAATSTATATRVYASWNGATQVASWRLLAGASPSTLTAVGQTGRTGFETVLTAPLAEAFVAVQALDAQGNVLGTTATSAPVAS